MDIPNENAIGTLTAIRKELDDIRKKKNLLEQREEELYHQLDVAKKGCTHKNADGTSAVEYVGPGYDGCSICGEWF